jgi:hypothetical protein
VQGLRARRALGDGGLVEDAEAQHRRRT